MEDVGRRARRAAWTWLPLLAWAGVITALSSRPVYEFPPPPFWQADKVVHLAIFGLLGALGGRAAARALPDRRALLVLAGCIAFGLFDEWYQRFTPGRASDLADWLADAVGAAGGFFLVLRYHPARHVSRHPPLR